MTEYRKDDRRWCCFHPTELVIGICALCLNERLLVLASKQGANRHHHHRQKYRIFSVATPKRALRKIFALASLLNLFEIKRRKADRCCHSSSISPGDSFISIKFEDNGVASWDKGSKIPKMPFDQQCEMFCNGNGNKAKKVKCVVEQSKPRAALRWRRRIGYFLQLLRLKKSTKGNMCHVSTKPRRSKG